MKEPLKVGERVMVRYSSASWYHQDRKLVEAKTEKRQAKILDIKGEVALIEWLPPMSGMQTFLLSACRRLKPKPKPREWTIALRKSDGRVNDGVTEGQPISCWGECELIKVREILK